MEDLGANPANTTPLTPLSFLDRAATIYGDCTSVVYGELEFTWSETRSRCLRLASALSSRFSLSRGDVVSVLAPNTPAMYELHFAVPMAGAVLNTLNTRLDARTLSAQLRHSSAKLLLVDYELLALASDALSLLPDHPPTLVPILDPSLPHNPFSGDQPATYEDLVAGGDPNFAWLRPTTDWAPMVLNYTSGTTAAPKGVVHSHRAHFLVALASLVDWSVPKQPVLLWTLPMFHGNGWSFPWAMAAVGGTNVCIRRFDGDSLHAAIRQHRVTHLCGAPVVLSMLVAAAAAAAPLPHRVHIRVGGAPPPPTALERAEALGFAVTHVYGLTESGVATTCEWRRAWDRLPVGERARVRSRQGVRTLAVDAVRVLDSRTGMRVPADGATAGQIVVRGPCVMLGYLKDPEATRSAVGADGWLRTGDVGVVHADGYLEITDRAKDVIVSGGENISSVEVERVVCGHPAVLEAAVVARPDERWGESPCAFVVAGGEVTEGEVIGYCRERMARFMAPRTVVFVAELPRTATGKVRKGELRERARAMRTAGPAMAAAKAGRSRM